MDIFSALSQPVMKGLILESAAKNLAATYNAAPEGSYVRASVDELLNERLYREINDRFYRTLAFGTGGLRGRTIGRHVTAAERGTPNPLGRPQFPCVGTNAMNDTNVERATRGLCRHLREVAASGQPTIVIAHDTRHFSEEFAALAARVATNEGVTAFLFPADRSTPQLSFTVRHLRASAGVVITASHNPPHDNGYKAYFSDGAQIVEPHASAIIRRVNEVNATGNLEPTRGAKVVTLGPEVDEAYRHAAASSLIDPAMLQREGPKLKIVYTPLHGTGIRAIRPLLKAHGVHVSVVPDQEKPDGRFPTVASPNPENGEALSHAIGLARAEGADAVIATDPDSDRMGVAVRTSSGAYELLTGNQIGCFLAHYRISTLVRQGVLTPQNASRACLIKTFVTTELQAAIASKFGLKVVNTLTGFKYIGEKLREYEEQLMAGAPAGSDYASLPPADRRAAHLARGCYFVFGGEESYGYLGTDDVRDKDANASALMFAEAMAGARSQGLGVAEYLDKIYSIFGFYWEKLGQVVLEGAEGSAKIARLLESYASAPPKEIGGHRVEGSENFAKDTLRDADGKTIPKEKMFIFHLDGGARIAVRGSGTEPKVKFYMFASSRPAPGKLFEPKELEAAKAKTRKFLDDLWTAAERDALARADRPTRQLDRAPAP